MDQAQPAVFYGSSDDEDYVAFDEQELQKGIGDLYDEDSASDYNDDDDADNMVDLNNIEVEEEEEEEEDNEMEEAMVIQQEKKAKKPKKFALFGRKHKEKESEEMRPKPSAFSSNNNNNNNRKSKKKSKSSQLSKRMHRLKQNQQQLHQQQHQQQQRKKRVVHKQKVNTNIISIDLGTLGTAATNISTGDAFECISCKSILSKHDVLLKQFEEIKLDDEDDSIWICKFCNHINIISIDNEEIPKDETVDYILAPPNNMDDESKSKDMNESQIVFCIDISGSMCVSQQVDAKHSGFKLKGNHLTETQDDLSQFIDANAGHLNKQKQDQQYVSRLQCVQTAVHEQIENIAKTNPNYKIGLVTFNNEVTVIGDGMSKYEIITGDKLNNMNKLQEIGSKCVVNNSIEQAKDKLNDALWKLQENGQTALGPALVVSIAMASTIPGSQVILCTDGLANIGVGSADFIEREKNTDKSMDMIEQDDDDEVEEDPVLKWYDALGNYAMVKGVVVNIISITDDGCRLENLGKIVEITNGNLKRINPLNLAEKFSGIIENESVATNCQAKMLLHPGLKFHNTVEAAQVNLDESEEDKNKQSKMEIEEKDENKNDNEEENTELDKINEGRKIYEINPSIQECGNIFAGSRIFFEYVINKEKKSEFKLLKQLPFQVQITYQKKDGSKMLRVISQTKEITMDRAKVRKNLDFNVLAKYGTHVTTELCAKGDYESSRAWTSANTTFLNKNANNKRQLLTLANYAQENVALDHQMRRQIQTESIQEQQQMNLDDDMFSGFAYNNNNNNNNNNDNKPKPAVSRKKAKKKKMAKRKGARNDQFSSHMYNLKKKAHK